MCVCGSPCPGCDGKTKPQKKKNEKQEANDWWSTGDIICFGSFLVDRSKMRHLVGPFPPSRCRVRSFPYYMGKRRARGLERRLTALSLLLSFARFFCCCFFVFCCCFLGGRRCLCRPQNDGHAALVLAVVVCGGWWLFGGGGGGFIVVIYPSNRCVDGSVPSTSVYPLPPPI